MVGRVLSYSLFDREPLVFARGRYVSAIDLDASDNASTAQGAPAASSGNPTLLQSLLRAYEGISEKFDPHRQAEGLSNNQSRVLGMLKRGPAESMAVIARGALLGERAAEDSTAVLLDRGLAHLGAGGTYEITQAGLAMMDRLIEQLRQVEREVTAQAPGLDIEAARAWLASLARAAESP